MPSYDVEYCWEERFVKSVRIEADTPEQALIKFKELDDEDKLSFIATVYPGEFTVIGEVVWVLELGDNEQVVKEYKFDWEAW